MPTKNPYYKKLGNSVTEEDRVQMVKLAIKDNAHFTFSGEELNREGTTYTVETLKNLTRKNPDCDYYFIMGADSLYHISSHGGDTGGRPRRLIQFPEQSD